MMTTDVRKGMVIMYNNEPTLVLEREFYKPGKGGAFNRTKLKGLKTGKIVSQTFRSGEALDEVEIQNRTAIFSYNDDENAYFFDSETYDTVPIALDMIDGRLDYLIADGKYIIMFFEDSPISIQIPAKVSLKVVETATGGDKGNTSGNPTKDAKLETGLVVQVPLFIKQGENIIISTESRSYVSKDNK